MLKKSQAGVYAGTQATNAFKIVSIQAITKQTK
jgi:hypothetical protein